MIQRGMACQTAKYCGIELIHFKELIYTFILLLSAVYLLLYGSCLLLLFLQVSF